MASEFRAGISFSEDKTQAVVVEIGEEGNVLRFIDEVSRKGSSEALALDESILNNMKSVGKFSFVNVALDDRQASIQTFPVEGTLSPTEKEEQLDWEWRNYLPEYSQDAFVRFSRRLQSPVESRVDMMLSAVHKKNDEDTIRNAMSSFNVSAGSIELNLFSVERALRFTHSEASSKNFLLMNVYKDRLDVCQFESGAMILHRYAVKLSQERSVDFIKELLKGNPPTTIYVYGSGATYTWLRSMRNTFGTAIFTLNPFRRLRIDPSVKNFSKFLGNEHRFCAAIGGALK